jgi:hypothetical protein
VEAFNTCSDAPPYVSYFAKIGHVWIWLLGEKNMKACTEKASPHYLQYEMRASTTSASASIPKLALY